MAFRWCVSYSMLGRTPKAFNNDASRLKCLYQSIHVHYLLIITELVTAVIEQNTKEEFIQFTRGHIKHYKTNIKMHSTCLNLCK